MISICTACDNLEAEKLFLASIPRLSHVSEVIICYQYPQHVREDEFVGDVRIKRVLYEELLWPSRFRLSGVTYNHALSLHTALDNASGEYVMFSDIDVIFKEDVTNLYLDALNQGADIAGVQHYAKSECYEFFPCIINCMMRRDKLPGPDFLKGYIKLRPYIKAKDMHLQWARKPPANGPTNIDGKWLLQSPIPEFYGSFPNPDGEFDAGCNLWLWAKQNGFKWVSFPTLQGDEHVYSTREYRSNFSYQANYNISFLYHKTMHTSNEDFEKYGRRGLPAP